MHFYLAGHSLAVLNQNNLMTEVSPTQMAESAGGSTQMGAEDPSEMALIAESAAQGNFRDGDVRLNEFLARLLDPEAPHIGAQRLAVHPPKAAHQVNRMNANNLRNLRKWHPISVVSVKEREHLLHPRKVH
jgi:hypothetical protein